MGKWLGLLNMFYFRIITMFVTFWGIIGCPIFVVMSEEFQGVTSMGPAITSIRRYLSICLLTHLFMCTAEALCQVPPSRQTERMPGSLCYPVHCRWRYLVHPVPVLATV